MQTTRFLHKILATSASAVHAHRLEVLLAAVHALLNGQRLGLTALGRQRKYRKYSENIGHPLI